MPQLDNKEIIEEILRNSHNFLIHGPGGTGKSFLIKELALAAESRGISVYKTATTGIAAINIGGITFHSFAGIGTGKSSIDQLISRIKTNDKYAKRWREVEILIVDEISMFGGELFDKINKIAQAIRGKNMPFGGIKVVFGGDFLQLPPVNDKWAFESDSWAQLNLRPIILSEPKRFNDPYYVKMLQRIREANCCENDVIALYSRHLAYKSADFNSMDIQPTILYSRRVDVENYNNRMIKAISAQGHVYMATDEIKVKNGANTFINREFYSGALDEAIDRQIVLKKGAQVMLKANLDIEAGLVNGSRGVVIGLYENYATVKFVSETRSIYKYSWEMQDGSVTATRSQIPLILAYALTIHKTQGCTLDSVICDLGSSIFESAQAYVALSRVRGLKSLYISNLSPRAIQANKRALEYVGSITK